MRPWTLPRLIFTGTYTHFACGEGTQSWELEFTQLQFHRYVTACEEMKKAGIPVGLQHCCSTGGALVHPGYQMDMIRLGMMPFGMSFSEESLKECGLKPAMKWISFVSQIKDIEPGETISYGCTFKAEKEMKIGLVACGYADGYHCSLSNKARILIGGKRVRVLGRVAMDYLVADLTDVEKPFRGMPAILMGAEGAESITALNLSEWSDSVCGEVTCSISKRVPRVYINP